MKLFHMHKYSFNQLRSLNQCRLFLQVITLFDIASAEGKTILSSATQDVRATERSSSLVWPRQESPPDSAWHLWRQALGHFSTQSKSHRSLGKWKTLPHQTWQWYMGPSNNIIYHKLTATTWSSYHAVPHPTLSTRRARQTRTRYHRDTHAPANPDISVLLPASIYTERGQDAYFYSMVSSTTFPQPSLPTPASSIWTFDSNTRAFVDTPEFHQRLISHNPPIDNAIGVKIATGMELESTC